MSSIRRRHSIRSIRLFVDMPTNEYLASSIGMRHSATSAATHEIIRFEYYNTSIVVLMRNIFNIRSIKVVLHKIKWTDQNGASLDPLNPKEL